MPIDDYKNAPHKPHEHTCTQCGEVWECKLQLWPEHKKFGGKNNCFHDQDETCLGCVRESA